MKDATQRFSGRVEDYSRYRPSYPPEIVDVLNAECGLLSSSVVADIGSGTGKLTEIFLANGNRVFAVEPNPEMRLAAETLLGRYTSFISIAARAEETTLHDRSVDFITSGQAFHWFDQDAACREFLRIIKDGGYIVLVWNRRSKDSTPFLAAYDRLLLERSAEYRRLSRLAVNMPTVADRLGVERFRRRVLRTEQVLDRDGLEGRFLSASYAPMRGSSGCEAILASLRSLFDEYEVDGKVTFQYDTEVCFSQLSAGRPL